MTRRSAVHLLAAAPFASFAVPSVAAAPVPSPRLLVGTYTGSSGSEGIYSSTWNTATGEVGTLGLAAATANPTFLAAAKSKIYAVNESGGEGDTVTSFSVEPGKTALRTLNSEPSDGKGPCHLALDHTGSALFVANYGGGSMASYRVTPEGLSAPVENLHFTGHGPKPQQDASHAHCVRLSPDNRFLLMSDLGLDRILVFHVEPKTAKLTPAAVPFYTAAAGAGPRHTLFHPNGRWLYSINELSSTIDLLAWSPKDGGLTLKATISSLPAEARGEKAAAAELVIDPAGRFLYASNRFHDSIAVFAIDPAAGTLAPLQDMPCGGKTPRHFALDPSGKWLLVANQDSNNIVVFARNPATGELTATGRSYALGKPVCLLFA